MGDAPSAASIWTFQNELGSSWMSSVTSVVTSSVMTSSIGTAGLRGVDAEEQRPHSQPAMPSSAFPSEPIVLDKSYPGHTALLMPGSGPGVYGNPIDMSTLYAQPALSAESLPAMWNPSLNPATGDITAPESKMVWTDWARQPDM